MTEAKTFYEYEYVLSALAEKSGTDIVVMRLRDTGALAEVFILATANSEVHMRTLMDAAAEAMEKHGRPCRPEGEESSNWRLLDGGDVVVHIFSRKGREFYRLDRLWAGADVLHYQGDGMGE